MQDEIELDRRGSLQLVGITVDDKGEPVSGARVSLDSETFATSDDAGQFVFVDLAPGLYRLEAHKDDLCADITLATLHETREPVVLTLSRGITLVIQVKDGDRPVAGARVMAIREVIAISDASGRAVVRNVGPAFQMFEIEADGYAPGFVSMWLAPDPGATLERTVALESGVGLGGIVVDPDGAPVAGASVRVWGTSWGTDATTDANGAWRMDAVARGAYRIHASSKTYAPRPDVVVELDGTTARTDLVVRLQRGGRIAGTVVDAKGSPVARPFVVALKEGDEQRNELVVRADADGRFELVLEPACYDVFAHDVHRASALHKAMLSDGDVCPVELVVQDAAIAGVVVDTCGNAVIGAEVRADAPIVCGDVTDRRGRFFLGALPPGEYDVEARRPDQLGRACGDRAGARVTAGDTNARLVLPAAAMITGRVLFEGKPLRHFGVQLTTCPQWPWIGRPVGIRTEDGRFELHDVTPGTWGLVFAGAGTSMHTIATLEVEAGATIDVGELHVPRGQRITGVVRDATGAAVAGARVIIGHRGLDADHEIDPLQQWFHNEFQTTTAPDGSFVFDGVTSVHPPNARPTPICATHPERGTSLVVAVPEGDATVELTLVETGTIEGIIEQYFGGYASVAAHRKGESADIRTARVSPSGAFVLDRMPPGDYAIVMTGIPHKPVAPPVELTVVANARASVRLVMPPSTTDPQ